MTRARKYVVQVLVFYLFVDVVTDVRIRYICSMQSLAYPQLLACQMSRARHKSISSRA